MFHLTGEWAGPARDALECVRQRLESISLSDQRMATCPALAGGKLLRAGLVILSGCCYSQCVEALITVGTAVELVHAASLLHDDLLDGAQWRRGRPTLGLVGGERSAMLVGDYLFARAFLTLSSLANLRLMQGFSTVVTKMCEAELKQLQQEGELDITEKQYFERIAGKTAHFMAECCRAGGRVSGASVRGMEALGTYGYNLGMAYQLLDDLADYTADARSLGKPVGRDIRGGIVTLPLILARKAKPQYEWQHWWKHRHETHALAQMVEAVRAAGVIPSLERVRGYTATAVAALTPIWHQPARRALESLPSQIREKHQ